MTPRLVHSLALGNLGDPLIYGPWAVAFRPLVFVASHDCDQPLVPTVAARNTGDPFPFLPKEQYPRVVVPADAWYEIHKIVGEWQRHSGRRGPVASSSAAARVLGISRDRLEAVIGDLPPEKRPINWGTKKRARWWWSSRQAVLEWWQAALKPEESKSARTVSKKRRTRRKTQVAEGPVDFTDVAKELTKNAT